jgi:hypothetical protein
VILELSNPSILLLSSHRSSPFSRPIITSTYSRFGKRFQLPISDSMRPKSLHIRPDISTTPNHVTRTAQRSAKTCMAPAELKQSASPQEHYRHTAARLARIQSHLETAPRTGKLKGKVAIITGAGSLKGIGYTLSNGSTFVILTCFLGGPLHYPLPMKVGRFLPMQ